MKHETTLQLQYIYLCILYIYMYITTFLYHLARKVIFIRNINCTSWLLSTWKERGSHGGRLARLFVGRLGRQNVEIKREVTKMWNKVTFFDFIHICYYIIITSSTKNYIFFKTLFDKTTFFGGQLSLEKFDEDIGEW